MIRCERCDEPLDGKQARWCSNRCSKLGLKALYRKRNKDKLYEYKNTYRRANKDKGILRPLSLPTKKRDGWCLHCGTTKDLQGAHVKPLWAGGTHDTIITLCRKHHHKFDQLLRDFWLSSIKVKKSDVFRKVK